MTRSPRFAGRGVEKGAVGCGNVVGCGCGCGCGVGAVLYCGGVGRDGIGTWLGFAGVGARGGTVGAVCRGGGWVGLLNGAVAGFATGASPRTSWTVRTTSSIPTWDLTR